MTKFIAVNYLASRYVAQLENHMHVQNDSGVYRNRPSTYVILP